MSFVLDTVTSDSYQYLSCPGTRKVSLQISNASALIGFGTASRPGALGTAEYPPSDEPYLPVTGGISRTCDEIRVKSYAPGTPANVKVVAT